MKKILITGIILSILTVNVNATKNITVNPEEILSSAIKKSEQIKQEYFEDKDKIVDLRKMSSKSTSKEPKTKDIKNKESFFGLISKSSNPTNSSSIECDNYIFGDYYAIAKSSSTVIEDYIYAKSRVYNSNGSLIADKSYDMNSASYVSATAINNTSVYQDWAYGNHIYKLDGYVDVVHQTYGTW